MSLSSVVRRALGGGNADEAPVVAGNFVHECEPPAQWVAALRDVSPLTDAHGTLEIVWEPGDLWFPVQRWMLFELVSTELIDYELLKELRGPNPRTTGHMCTRVTVPGQFACQCKVKLDGWRTETGDPSPVTLTQWKLFRRTGKFGRAFWVIQGEHGGTKAFLTEEERQMLTAAGKKASLPGAGDLPYADFDLRVLEHVVRFNRLRKMGMGLREFKKRMKGPGYKLHKAEIQKELRKQLLQWLTEQQADNSHGPSVNELFLDAAKKGEIDAHAARTSIDWEKVGEASEHEYLETGQLLHPTKVK